MILDADGKPAAPIVDAAILAQARADTENPTSATTGDAGAGTAAPAAGAPGRVIDYDAEAREVMEFAAALFFPLRPGLEKIYTPEVRERVAAAGAPLLRKYNIDLSLLGPELTFAVVIIPLIAPTVAAIRANDRSPKVKNEKAAEAKTPAETTTAAGGAVGAEVTPENPLNRFPGLKIAA